MNYIPCVAWYMCPGGTTKEVANYAASWGLMGDAPQGLWTPDIAIAGYSIPTHAIWIAMPNTARSIMSIILLIFMSLQ